MLKFLSQPFFIAIFWFSTSGIHAQAETLNRYQYTQYHMGVDVRITLYAPNAELAERASHAAFERFAELDTIMSDYRPNSELMLLCTKAVRSAVPVSRDLFVVLMRSQELARLSDGAFDITCGPLVSLWRKARKTHLLPSASNIENARASTGWRHIAIDTAKRTVRLELSGMKLDLGGIAKGYADDCAQKVLKQLGIHCAMVEAGGDIVVSDSPPGQIGWKILIPNHEVDSKPSLQYFSHAAISTSGDTEQFVDIGGKRYSHIVDPRTGQALTDRVEVTIIAPDGLTSDGLSTAVSVLGKKSGLNLLKRYPGTKGYVLQQPLHLDAQPSRTGDK